jgi:hypothetical protein
MLLGHVMLARKQDPIDSEAQAVATIWRYREGIEYEAAALFDMLANQLAHQTEPETLVAMARQAADDERDHARRCRLIVNHYAPLSPVVPAQCFEIAPTDLPLREKLAYAMAAVSCVTETLSAALLLEMQDRAGPKLIRDTVHAIAKDEIRHSRLGWAYLRNYHVSRSLAWLSPYVPAMLSAAMTTDLEPMTSLSRADLSRFGILGRQEIMAICNDAAQHAIFPGFDRLGIDTTQARKVFAPRSPDQF